KSEVLKKRGEKFAAIDLLEVPQDFEENFSLSLHDTIRRLKQCFVAQAFQVLLQGHQFLQFGVRNNIKFHWRNQLNLFSFKLHKLAHNNGDKIAANTLRIQKNSLAAEIFLALPHC